MVSTNVGAEWETEKEGEEGAKPHRMTHNFTRSHDEQPSICVLSEAEAITRQSILYIHHMYLRCTIKLHQQINFSRIERVKC